MWRNPTENTKKAGRKRKDFDICKRLGALRGLLAEATEIQESDPKNTVDLAMAEGRIRAECLAVSSDLKVQIDRERSAIRAGRAFMWKRTKDKGSSTVGGDHEAHPLAQMEVF